jgi:hypothetical protein
MPGALSDRHLSRSPRRRTAASHDYDLERSLVTLYASRHLNNCRRRSHVHSHRLVVPTRAARRLIRHELHLSFDLLRSCSCGGGEE